MCCTEILGLIIWLLFTMKILQKLSMHFCLKFLLSILYTITLFYYILTYVKYCYVSITNVGARTPVGHNLLLPYIWAI